MSKNDMDIVSQLLKFFGQVVQSLRNKPAYILIFAICAGFDVGAIIYVIEERTLSGLLVFAGVVVASLIVTLVAIKLIDSPIATHVHSMPQPTPVSGTPLSVAGTAPIIAHPQFSDVIRDLNDIISGAASKQNPLLNYVVQTTLDRFKRQCGDWPLGRTEISDDYRDVLVGLYKRASNDIFATSAPRYLDNWSEPLGKSILEEHERSAKKGVAIQRVFIFDDENPSTPAARRVMQRHVDAGVQVFSCVRERYPYDQDDLEDFTFIDGGAAIGVTAQFIPNQLRAQWYFSDEHRKKHYGGVKERLIGASARFP